MVPPPLTEEEYRRRRHGAVRLQWYVRGGLIALAFVPMTVFAVAWGLNPYRDGRVWLEETHRQLGLPPCNFRVLTENVVPGGLPCPSCGMTSSFALFVRGDLVHSLEANCAGTMLALLIGLYIPWGIGSAACGRVLWVKRWEWWVIRLTLFFTLFMFVRWGIVIAWRLWNAR